VVGDDVVDLNSGDMHVIPPSVDRVAEPIREEPAPHLISFTIGREDCAAQERVP
jgi:hypothetical protein